MKTLKTDFPRRVRVIENTWIPMADGCRLAAKVWLPEDAEADPVPALLEYIPYRKGDWTSIGDSTRHAYFAGHGYASVRVDMRGSGELKRKNLTPASRETVRRVAMIPTPRCARNRKRTVDNDIGPRLYKQPCAGRIGGMGRIGRMGRMDRAVTTQNDFPILSVLPFLPVLPRDQRSRLLISVQFTTFHQASM